MMVARFIKPSLMICACLLLCSCGGGGTPAAGVDPEYSFDPKSFPELELKGVTPEGATSWGALIVPPRPSDPEKLLERGHSLYAKACAACHGATGKGDGVLTLRADFNMPPANFTKPTFSINIRTTLMGTLPVDEDLFRSITRGLPGTAMLSYRDLPADDRWALAAVVTEFFSGGKWAPAQSVVIPPKIPPDAALLEEGRESYKVCANCHGPAARGGTAVSFNRLTGKPYPAIAFARGGGKYMFGGSTDEDIARTLLTGFGSASPMMSFKTSFYGDDPTPAQIKSGDRKLWATVHYVRTLLSNSPE